jgi:predicted transcriptional regulator
MSDVKITVGGEMEDEAARRLVDAWRRAEHGESFHERHLAFESRDALARVLTAKRSRSNTTRGERRRPPTQSNAQTDPPS